ncbi:MAG: hypothetical protein ACK5E3_07920 [Planctomycetota bacterium]
MALVEDIASEESRLRNRFWGIASGESGLGHAQIPAKILAKLYFGKPLRS